MARHDVFIHRDGEGFLLDVQADILDALATRVVVPLLPIRSAPEPAARLNLVFTIGETKVMMATQFLAAVPSSILIDRVASLESEHDLIVAALDMVFQGF
ncbi:CcdB family protein [Mangrovibrevibacter kandeliae]|uniref:CcdB family protein n=1 Tax=Mangrovibrevibacter kandeliae TaxID=2968473 RepID=UPI002117B271|nr:CcdB family protein [Aurantimonas sp. CSK15Z-1]MCQ8783111.1 CcdB family protein [Aurantimonas sp. CSK15Z-1]